MSARGRSRGTSKTSDEATPPSGHARRPSASRRRRTRRRGTAPLRAVVALDWQASDQEYRTPHSIRFAVRRRCGGAASSMTRRSVGFAEDGADRCGARGWGRCTGCGAVLHRPQWRGGGALGLVSSRRRPARTKGLGHDEDSGRHDVAGERVGGVRLGDRLAVLVGSIVVLFSGQAPVISWRRPGAAARTLPWAAGGAREQRVGRDRLVSTSALRRATRARWARQHRIRRRRVVGWRCRPAARR